MYPNPMALTLWLLAALSVCHLAGAEEAVVRQETLNGAQAVNVATADDGQTPEERMNRRFPQKVKVGDLLGLALQDDDDRVLGVVHQVVRTRDGKIVLVTTSGTWFGLGGRPVGVPLETVAILARHLDLLDIPRQDFLSLPTWQGAHSTTISPDETIRIAITRR